MGEHVVALVYRNPAFLAQHRMKLLSTGYVDATDAYIETGAWYPDGRFVAYEGRKLLGPGGRR